LHRGQVDTTGTFLPGVPGYSVRDVSLVHEVQAIHLAFDDNTTPQSGTFTLTWGGLTTPVIPITATASRVAFELQAITGSFLVGVDPILVSRESAENGYVLPADGLAARGKCDAALLLLHFSCCTSPAALPLLHFSCCSRGSC
jgi:hypothetical protein